MLMPFIAFAGIIWSMAVSVAVAAAAALLLMRTRQRGHYTQPVEHNKLTHYMRHATEPLKSSS